MAVQAFLRPLLLAACTQLLLAVRDDEVRQQQAMLVHGSGAVIRERHHQDQDDDDGGADDAGPAPDKGEDDDDSDDFAVDNYEDSKNATPDPNATAVSADIVVTTWNVGQLPTMPPVTRNPFAYWFEGARPLFLMAEEIRHSTVTVQAFVEDARKSSKAKVEDPYASISDPAKWEANGFIKGGAIKPTPSDIESEWKSFQAMTLSDFFSEKNLAKDQKDGGYEAQKVADSLPLRFLNDFFVCPGGPEPPVRKDGYFKVREVMKVLVFDVIVQAVLLKTNATSDTKLATLKKQICERSSSDTGRLESIKEVVKQADTSVLFLQEVPKAWIPAILQKALSDGTGKQWLVLAPKQLTDKGNLATAVRLDKFDDDTAVVQNEDTLTGVLSISVSPANFSSDNITLINLRLPDTEKLKDIRLKGMGKLLDSNWTLDQATIAAGDTEGEPRRMNFRDGKYFVDEGFVDKEIYRATNAPWGNNSKLPAYGTTNLRRSGFEIANAGKIERMLQDNIYYTTTQNIRITQKDLCSGDSCMKRYTFDKKLQCFGGSSQEDRNRTAEEKAAGANTGPKGKRYPRTCGYVGRRPATYLPDPSLPFGISSHSPISARFLIEQTQGEAIARRGGSPRSSVPACFLLLAACLASASRWL